MERRYPERRVYSPEQKTQAAEAKLTAALEQITTEDSFKRWLSVAAKFHQYSPTNTALIFAQDPDATKLKGYRQWQELNRQVILGAKAIEIFAPIWPKGTTKDQQKDLEPSGFIPVKVFDVRQTTGEPLPEGPKVPILEGEQGKREYPAMTLGALEKDFLVTEEEELAGDIMGYYSPLERAIVVRQQKDGKPLSPLQKVKTLAHEFAHGISEHGHEGNHTSYEVGETVAEGSAYIALAHFNIDSSERSFPYIAHWARDTKVLRNVMGAIQRTARVIIDSTEAHLDVVHSHDTDALPEPVRAPLSASRGPFKYNTAHAFYQFGTAPAAAPAIRAIHPIQS